MTGRYSAMSFRSSLRTGQPLPDSYFTWVTIENQGSVTGGAGSASGTFGFALNDIIQPFSKTGSILASLPNPVKVVTTENPTGVSNLLFNAGTATGIYQLFRVWAAEVIVSYLPQSVGGASENANIAMAPVNSGSRYTDVEGITGGPNAVSLSAMQGASGGQNSIRALYKMPALAGLPARVYKAFVAATGSAAATPTQTFFVQVGHRNCLNADFAASSLGIKVVIRYHVEFFNRVDSALLVV